ncbi:MAG: response regulator [Hyphomicrobiales bacterium]|nr:response regulator [Hyphomicrobiales bacterium]MBV8825118.1 response regulator [Hyphomicrobiales bacterium]MBV9427009.1 response regulator [Bradyrhizobiaceae bacterium]
MRTVLVVDDEPLVLDLTATMLEDLGYQVVLSTGAREALQKLRENSAIEIIITDINMPEISGYELAHRAKRVRADLKIVFLSGREGDGHGHPLLRKPFVETDLIKVIEPDRSMTR